MKTPSRVSLRILLRQQYRNLIDRRKQDIDLSDLKKSAVVFAPHQDDETLGCGGTILRKKAMGAAVKVVFMTDGCRSHRQISPHELRSIRQQEALSACKVLGVDQQDVIFLDIEDGRLGDHQDLARQKVVQILQTVQPREVFIPYRRDPHADHMQTSLIVLSALKACQIPVTVYEYPVWVWHHWPWIGCSGGLLTLLRVVKKSLSLGFGLFMVKEFRSAVPIKEVVDLKRSALDQHRSQVTRFRPDVDWVTLGDVSDGEFIDCFFQDHELFRRYRVGQDQ